MSLRELPDGLVNSLNELGFMLADGDIPYTFVRLTMDGEMQLLIQAVGRDKWRVGLASRAQAEAGRLPNPLLTVSLHAYGPSQDGITLEVSDAELGDELPSMLGESLLPAWDSTWY